MARTMRDPKKPMLKDPEPIVVEEPEEHEAEEKDGATVTNQLAQQLLKRLEEELDELEAVLLQSDSVIGELRKRREWLRVRIEALEFDPRQEEEDEVDWSGLKKKGNKKPKKIKDYDEDLADWEREDDWGEDDELEDLIVDVIGSTKKGKTVKQIESMIDSWFTENSWDTRVLWNCLRTSELFTTVDGGKVSNMKKTRWVLVPKSQRHKKS